MTNSDLPKIEIYLPKERIKTKDGVEITREWNFIESTRTDSSMIHSNKLLREFARLDTVTDNYIYAGSYNADEDDLDINPFIYENEIISFDFETSELEISASGAEKLWNLQEDFIYSRQFIITADRKPILTGYFYGILSSSYVNHFYIFYENGGFGEKKPVFENEKLRIEYNSKSMKGFFKTDKEKYDFKTIAEFYNAFKLSGRIAE
ncbi:MAG: hypothetical protein ACSHW7_12625 [Patiriisocius sp.]|uniref:hypothetical protein n=1 Tax=Patiriisocius sp. TaxID=2822396 RepID=UPI003EF54250